MKKNVVVGLGEIGKPILKIISKSIPTIGFDINQKLVAKNQKKYNNNQILYLIKKMNNLYAKKVKNAKTINKNI